MGYICPVCGFDDLFEPPYVDDSNSGSYEICPCCKFQFGYTGASFGKEYHKFYRDKWIRSGAKWFDQSAKPSNWSLEEQLKNIGVFL